MKHLSDPSDSDDDIMHRESRFDRDHKIRRIHEDLGTHYELPASIIMTGEMPYWLAATGRIFVMFLAIAKFCFHITLFVFWIKYGTSLSYMGSDVKDPVAHGIVIAMYVFETIICFAPVITIFSGHLPMRIHSILGIVSLSSSCLAGWLGIVYCFINGNLGILGQVLFGIYWGLVVVVSCSAGFFRTTDRFWWLNHSVWTIRYTTLCMCPFIYRLLIMIPLISRLGLTVVVSSFYIVPIATVEILIHVVHNRYSGIKIEY